MPGTLAFTLIFNSVFAPALAGVGAGLLAHKLLCGRQLATALAAIAGMLCIYGNQFMWPPLQAMDWLLLLLPLFALPALLFTKAASYWAMTLVVSLAAAYFILNPALRFAASPLLTIAAAGMVWAIYLASQSKGHAGRGETGALAGVALASAIIIITTGGSALLGQLMGALCATSVGLLLFSLISKQPMPLLSMRAAIFGVSLIATAYAEIHFAWLALPLLLAIAAPHIARRFTASHILGEGLAFIIVLIFSAPAWGTLLVRRLGNPAAY